MAYIGAKPVNGFFAKQDISTDGSTTTFALDFTISSTSSIQFTFTTDGSSVGSGINAIVSLVYSSISASPSISSSITNSPKARSSLSIASSRVRAVTINLAIIES